VQRTKVNAILDTDLPQFLVQNGLLEAFNNGTIKCVHCARVLDQTNVHAVFKQAGKIVFCCNLAGCMNKQKAEKTS
jgi:hypothetical protein